MDIEGPCAERKMLKNITKTQMIKKIKKFISSLLLPHNINNTKFETQYGSTT